MKQNRKFFLGIIVGILFSSVGVYAATTYLAGDVTYTPSNKNWNVNNVGDALDRLYFNSNFKIYYLGSGVSFNIKELYPDIDSSKLTKDNFIVGINSIPAVSTSNSEENHHSNANASGLNLSYSYDQETGILTIDSYSQNIIVKTYDYSSVIDSKTKVQQAECFAYLVLGEIVK